MPPIGARFDQWIEAARSALSESAFAAAWRAGQALPPEQAVELALHTAN